MDELEFLALCCKAGEVEINPKGGFFFSYLTGYIPGDSFDELMTSAMQEAEKTKYKELTDYQMMKKASKIWKLKG